MAIATKIFWALGYNQVESFLTTLRSEERHDRSEGDGTPSQRQDGRRLRNDDINVILESVVAQRRRHLSRHRGPAAAGQDSRRLPVRRHAPRRSQRSGAARAPPRAARAARLRRVDQPHRPQGGEHDRPLVTRERQVHRQALPAGRRLDVRHVQRQARMGSELRVLLSKGRPSRKRFFTLGFGLSPWQTVDYVEYPSVGKFEGKVFDPRKWRPQTPTTAYMEMRDDDAFWAAQRIAAFTDDHDSRGRSHGRVQRSRARRSTWRMC